MQEDSRPEENSEQTQAKRGKGQEAVYEIGVHFVPTLTEEETAASFDKLKDALERASASLIAQEAPRKLELAYRIERPVAGRREKYTESRFGFIKFEFPSPEEAGSAVGALEKTLQEDRSVLRFLLIKTSREAPSAPRLTFVARGLESRTIAKPDEASAQPQGPIDESELDKSIEALVGEESAG